MLEALNRLVQEWDPDVIEGHNLYAFDLPWIRARAEANGRLVFTNDDKVAVKKPVVAGSATMSLQFGATILELDAEIDSRGQYAAVKSSTWDPAQQSVVEKDGADPGFAGPGNLTADDLAAHRRHAESPGAFTKLYPTWRPDRARGDLDVVLLAAHAVGIGG